MIGQYDLSDLNNHSPLFLSCLSFLGFRINMKYYFCFSKRVKKNYTIFLFTTKLSTSMKTRDTQEILNLLEETNKRLAEMLNKKADEGKKMSSTGKTTFNFTGNNSKK